MDEAIRSGSVYVLMECAGEIVHVISEEGFAVWKTPDFDVCGSPQTSIIRFRDRHFFWQSGKAVISKSTLCPQRAAQFPGLFINNTDEYY